VPDTGPGKGQGMMRYDIRKQGHRRIILKELRRWRVVIMLMIGSVVFSPLTFLYLRYSESGKFTFTTMLLLTLLGGFLLLMFLEIKRMNSEDAALLARRKRVQQRKRRHRMLNPRDRQ
jgi:hypothetical protein